MSSLSSCPSCCFYFPHSSAMVVGDEYLSPVLPSSVLCLRRAAPQRPSEYAGQTVGAQQNSSSATSTHVQRPPQARAEVSEYAWALLNNNMTTVALPCEGVEDFNNTSALGGKWESQASLHISSSWLEISKRSKHIDHPWYWNIFFVPKGKFWGTHTGRKVTGSSKESCPVYPSGLLPCMLQLMSTKRQLQSFY